MELSTLVLLAVAAALGALVAVFVARSTQARLRGELDKERAVHAERLKAFTDAEVRFRDSFQALSAEALQRNNEAFLDLAAVRLSEARTEATTDIDQRKKAIEDLLAPVNRALEQVDKEIKESERRRVTDGAALLQQIAALDAAGKELRGETGRLVDALKRPGVRGRWGELQLKRVIELAGMIEHCHFTEQQTIQGEEGRLRPDVIVQLPGGKQIVIDAKAPLDAYLKALDAPNEDARRALLVDHARQVRTHLGQLAAKNYSAQLPVSPDFVVMFLPGEMFFSAALEQDPSLIEYGVERHVIPASPTTLIALLRAVAYGWQQQAMEDNARKISDLGRNLYEAIRVLTSHVDVMGVRLKSSVDAYNQAVGSLERNVLVKARKFKELHAASGAEDIPALSTIDQVPRLIQAPELTDGLPFAESTADVEQ